MEFGINRIIDRLISKIPIQLKKNSCIRRLKEKLIKRPYPIVVGSEFKLIKKVLKSRNWNMSYGDSSPHHILENELSEYLGVGGAAVVNTGGMAIQMALRGLGFKYTDEVIHIVDTCVANSFAIMNSGINPIFADSNPQTFLLDFDDLEKQINKSTKAIMPIHLWGSIENMDKVVEVAEKYDLKIIEDACLSFLGKYKNKYVGSIGDVGIFSFGSAKPIQSGEGGIIVSDDELFIREIKAMRNWGDRTLDFGERDHNILSWNGRTSEINCVVMLEQFRGYMNRMNQVQESVGIIKETIEGIEGVELIEGDKSEGNFPIYSQIILKLDIKMYSKDIITKKMNVHRISARDANFELIPQINFFRSGSWKKWVISNSMDRIEKNYNRNYSNALKIQNRGIGISATDYLTIKKGKQLAIKLKQVFDG